jgi:hypothetical protein
MLNRVSLDRAKEFADVVIDFVPDSDPGWPDIVELTACSSGAHVRLRLHLDELEVLAVALDGAVTGSDGELYFRPAASAGAGRR